MADIQVSRQTVIAFPDDNVTLTEGIMDASLSVSEILLSKHIAFGELNINKFEVDLHTDRDVIGKKIYVYQNVGTSVVPIFTGYVQSSKLDDFGEYRHLVAYDLFYTKGVLDIADWWNTYWESNEVSTLGALLRNLLSTFNIPYTDKVLLNDSMPISKTQEIASMKLSDMLKLICEANLCNPNINRQGVLEFVTVYNATEKSVIDNYEWNNSDFEDYTLAQIGLIQIWNRDGHIGVSVGSGTNCLAIKNNFFFYDKETSELSTLATAIYNAVHGITYTPASIKLILQDPTIKVGDMIRSSKGVSLVTEIEMSGAMLIEETLKSNGEEITAEADSYNPTDSKVKDTQKQVQQVSSGLAVVSSQVQQLMRKIVNKYILPFGIVLDEVTDTDQGGTSNNVLMFRYVGDADNSAITIHAELNFNVHTFEKTISGVDYFQDAIINAYLVLDETTTLVSLVEHMRDGWHTLVLDYLLGSAPSGQHDIYLKVQSQGASLFSMSIIKGYINAMGTSSTAPKEHYNILDMSYWIQTVANFMQDTYANGENVLDVTIQSDANIYEKTYKQVRVDPLGVYKITFELKVVESYTNNRGADKSVRFEVLQSQPSSGNYTYNPISTSEAFPTTASESYQNYELTYTNTVSYYIGYKYNYILFNFGGMLNQTGKFNIKNIQMKKTNANLMYTEWKPNTYYRHANRGSMYPWDSHWFKTADIELDVVIVRGSGKPATNVTTSDTELSIVRIVFLSPTALDIDSYIVDRSDFFNPQDSIAFAGIITLSNNRQIYTYVNDGIHSKVGQPIGDPIYYSSVLHENETAVGGSIDIYMSQDELTHDQYSISYELDDYLCERWGDPE